jgi:hypothetical protein
VSQKPLLAEIFQNPDGSSTLLYIPVLEDNDEELGN